LHDFLLKLHKLSFEQDAKALADSWGVPYLECSSKTGQNVNEVFHTLLREVSKDDDILQENEENGCNIL
jgi:Ras family.